VSKQARNPNARRNLKAIPKRFHITIPDGDGGMPLRVSRTFAGLPVKFTLVSAGKDRGTHWSRYCDEHVVSEPRDDEALLELLMSLEKRSCPNVLLPIMTPAFAFVAEHREMLASRFRIPAIPSIENLTIASDKWKLYGFCFQHGLPVLRSVPLSEAAFSHWEGDGNPADSASGLLVKPRESQGGEGFIRVAAPDALDDLRHRLGEAEVERRFVQPFVDGYDVSLAAYCEGGEIKCHNLWRAVTYGPRAFAMPECIRFFHDEAIVALGHRLLSLLQWEGICDIDFFVDRHTGEAWILEVNARLFGSVPACAQAGVHFTRILCERAMSREEREWPVQRPEVYCETSGLLRALEISEVRFELLRHPIKRLSIGLSLRDPGPDVYQRLAKLGASVKRWIRGFRTRPDEAGVLRRESSWLSAVGIAFLCAQLGSILYSPFIPEKFFCWAPFDQHTLYSIEVTIDGRALGADEIASRYRYPQSAWEVREIQNVISIVRQYERTYGTDENASVSLTYRTNGHEQRTWTWPRT
jgi:predicted ATP-grasp superfamily ATP-dependent carboligase